jgi:hypothetical protein
MSLEMTGMTMAGKWDRPMGAVEFYMDSQLVGTFPSDALPTTNGTYRYEVYRSPGHPNLHRLSSEF